MKKLNTDTFFEHSLEMLCIADTNGYFLKINPRWSEILGYTEEELTEVPFISFVHPDDIENTVTEAQKLADGDHRTIHFKNRYRKKDGNYCWLLWTSTAIDNYIYAAARDITEIVEQKTLFEETQKVANIGAWKVDLITMTPMWSEKTYEIHEVPYGEKVNIEEAINFYAPSARPIITKHFNDCVENQTSYDVELPFITAKGNHKWVRAVGMPIVSDGKVTEMIGIFQDITKMKETYIALEKASKLAALGQMAGGISHEVNNPLSIISMLSSKLRHQINKGEFEIEDLKSSLDTLDQTVDRISKIINGLKFLARHKEAEDFSTISITDIIQNTVSLCQEKFRINGISLVIKDETHETNIECQPVPISQILVNLLNNAFDVVINEGLKNIEISATIDDNKEFVTFTVTDSGPGVPKEIQDKIFEPFYTTKEIGAGTGLGLGISSEIANSHNGSLELDDQHPHGRFVLTLPLKQSNKVRKSA